MDVVVKGGVRRGCSYGWWMKVEKLKINLRRKKNPGKMETWKQGLQKGKKRIHNNYLNFY